MDSKKGIKQIKNYRLTRELGRGANGVVYEAVENNTFKKYAVKAIPSNKLEDKKKMENFKRELKALYELKHDNIIKLIGVEKTVNNIYVILEFSNGGNLLEFLTFFKKKYNSPLPERVCQHVIKQVIDGLHYMHDRKMVHRDIKLENILLNFTSVQNIAENGESKKTLEYNELEVNNWEDIEVKIADLGYARELEGGGVASTICGTPITMAPDIINIYMNNKGKNMMYNEKADLWSLGSICYELLIGNPPFFANDYINLFKEVMKGKYNIPKNLKISVEAITFINGLLTFNAEKRFGWDDILIHPFITNSYEDFHKLELDVNEKDMNQEQLQVDTKDCDNFLWVLFKKPKIEQNNKDNLLELDKIDNSILDDKQIMGTLELHKNDYKPPNTSNKKKSLLKDFRKGAKSSKHHDEKQTDNEDNESKKQKELELIEEKIRQEKEEEINLLKAKEEELRVFKEKEEEMRKQRELDDKLRVQKEKELDELRQKEREEEIKKLKEKEEEITRLKLKEKELLVLKEKEEELLKIKELEAELKIQKEREELLYKQREEEETKRRLQERENELKRQIVLEEQLMEQKAKEEELIRQKQKLEEELNLARQIKLNLEEKNKIIEFEIEQKGAENGMFIY